MQPNAQASMRKTVSSQGERIRPQYSRSDLHRRDLVKTSTQQYRRLQTPAEQQPKQKFDQIGLYFDVNQAKDLSPFKPMAQSGGNPNGNPSPPQQRAKSGFVFSESNQKLYSPYEYLHYATRVSRSKEVYLNALQQLGYEQAQSFQSRPYNEIIKNTNQLIKKSYSEKYMGIIDGNMGILTNRKNIQQVPTHAQQQQQQQQVAPQPANGIAPPISESKYLVGKYSLPRGLKSIKKQRDPQVIEQKIKLEQWHAEKIHHPNEGSGFQGDQRRFSEQTHKHGGFLPKQTIQFQGNGAVGINNQIARTESSSNIRMKSSLYKKPVYNYEENAEEGICYAIIEQNPHIDALSYSKLLSQIDRKRMHSLTSLNDPRLKKIQLNQPGVSYTQNQNLLNRFETIENNLINES